MSATSLHLHVVGIIGWPELAGIAVVLGIPAMIIFVALKIDGNREKKRKSQPPPLPPKN